MENTLEQDLIREVRMKSSCDDLGGIFPVSRKTSSSVTRDILQQCYSNCGPQPGASP